jgi:ATP-dependent helicase/DNAse subunit B
VPLTLVLGPANSAKAGEVLGAYALAARRDALLVVPTAADAVHYDRELVGTGVVLGRALTFTGLIAEMARRAGYSAPRLTALQQQRLLRTAVAGLSLRSLGESAVSAGFPAAVGRLSAELQTARVSSARFTSALRTWAGEDADRRAYAEDLAAVYRGYLDAVERTGRADPARFAWAALNALRAAPFRWGATPVFFYGFDDLTAIERDAVETLAGSVGAAVTVSLTYEASRVAMSARAGVAEDLRSVADTVRELPSLDEHYGTDAANALHHVERHLFEPEAPRLDPGPAVRLLEAGGERSEAELVAAEVVAALEAGVPPEEIVVVCRSLTRSGALFERTLKRYGVPAWSRRTVPFGHTALGHGLLALARCALVPDASASDLLAYLRLPGVAEPRRVDQLESEVARRGLTGLADARDRFPLELPELDALRTAQDPSAELAHQARRLLERPWLHQAPQLAPDAELDARAAVAAVSAVDELAELDPPTPLPTRPADLLEQLESLEVPVYRPDGPPRDAVLVSEPLSIRARRFRRVFVCGLCEGEFPAATAPDPFLGDERRRELALASGLALPAEEDSLARERYLLYACVSRATERLILSFRSSDEEGKLVLPSPFLHDLAELFVPDWWERRRRRLLADVVWAPEEAPTERERQLAMSAAAGACGHPAAGSGETRHLGETALQHVRHREILSGGALEKFASCPVAWLVESQLAPDELAPDSDALVRGSFMHDVLEKVIRRLGAALTPATLPRAESLLDEMAAEAPDTLGPGRPAAVRAAILRGVEADLRRYLRHEARDGCDWTPMELELRFGFQDEDPDGPPPLELIPPTPGSADPVRIRGVIDRIDHGPEGQVIVRDYKSGANRPERAGARWIADHQLQVALYMIAVRRLLGQEPVAGFYQPLTGRDLRIRGAYAAGSAVGRCAYNTDAMPTEDLDGLLAEIEEQAVELARTLGRGELTPCPETCSRDGCRHPGICWA